MSRTILIEFGFAILCVSPILQPRIAAEVPLEAGADSWYGESSLFVQEFVDEAELGGQSTHERLFHVVVVEVDDEGALLEISLVRGKGRSALPIVGVEEYDTEEGDFPDGTLGKLLRETIGVPVRIVLRNDGSIEAESEDGPEGRGLAIRFLGDLLAAHPHGPQETSWTIEAELATMYDIVSFRPRCSRRERDGARVDLCVAESHEATRDSGNPLRELLRKRSTPVVAEAGFRLEDRHLAPTALPDLLTKKAFVRVEIESRSQAEASRTHIVRSEQEIRRLAGAP